MQAFYIMEYILNAFFVVIVAVAVPSVVKSVFAGRDRKRKNSI
jgi:hypothetical protein